MAQRVAHVSMLQKRLYDGLWKHIQYITLNGPVPGPLRICNTLNLSTEFIEGDGQLLLLDYQGIAVASGSASSASRSRSPMCSTPSSLITRWPRATSS